MTDNSAKSSTPLLKRENQSDLNIL
jgi:hypothetical protein